MDVTTTTDGVQAALFPEMVSRLRDVPRLHRARSVLATEFARQVEAYAGNEPARTTSGAVCATCTSRTCLPSGVPCAAVEAVLADGENQRRCVDAQLWGDYADMERYYHGRIADDES